LSTTKLGILAVVIAGVIVVVALRKGAVDAVRTSDSVAAQGALPAATATSSADSGGKEDSGNDRSPPLPPTASSRERREPTYAEPQQIENLVLQIIARQPGLAAVGLSVSCDAAQCEIALRGRETNPVRTAEYDELFAALSAESRPEFRVPIASMGTREIAPGAREYVISFEYQPYEDLSDDATIAARQQAACAAAWRRLTENPTPDDVVRSYLEQEERRLKIAAVVLGRAEAERLETERLAIRGGPLHRECQL
jgi:hypothetical protein